METIKEHKSLTAVPQDRIIFPKQLPTIAQMNQALLDEAMSRTANNQTAAAQILGISQSALSRRLKGVATLEPSVDFTVPHTD
jgi:transcriptional regulator with PAS, ATPase and Fis domain